MSEHQTGKLSTGTSNRIEKQMFKGRLSQLEQLQYQLTRQELLFAQRFEEKDNGNTMSTRDFGQEKWADASSKEKEACGEFEIHS